MNWRFYRAAIFTAPDEYPPVPSSGRFTGSVIAINRDGSLSDKLIRMALDSDGTEELEIEDSAGVVASTEVDVAIPTITIDPAEGSVPRGGEITITGQNFPIYHDDYNREEIEDLGQRPARGQDRILQRFLDSKGHHTPQHGLRNSIEHRGSNRRLFVPQSHPGFRPQGHAGRTRRHPQRTENRQSVSAIRSRVLRALSAIR